ncbi:MAG: diaminopimelate decarboxylase [Gammaproteobacteria bacterium]
MSPATPSTDTQTPAIDCHYANGQLALDGVALEAIASAVGTPTYVYSRGLIEARWRAYDAAFGTRAHRVCYAVKANDNLSILRSLGLLGAGFDIVSAGELARVLASGAAAADVIFSGVGKTAREIEYALTAGIGCLNVESTGEIECIAAVAGTLGRPAPIAVRVNPDIDAGTHRYISTGLRENKFGIPIEDAPALYRRIVSEKWLEARGVACHIGSQLTSSAPIIAAVQEVVALMEGLEADGIELDHIDVGGGLGISYQDERPPSIADLVAAVIEVVPERYTIVMEPGRSLVGEAGLLLTRVEYAKPAGSRNFVIVDAAMNDLLRPALYEAWHEVRPCAEARLDEPGVLCDVVGPICESGDWLARARELAVQPGDLLAIMDTGAYGFAMASNYNARPRPAEVLVYGGDFHVVRPRERTVDLFAREQEVLIEK